MAAFRKNNDIPEKLSGKFVGSFAYKTITDRMPVILTKVVDRLFRERNDIAVTYGEDAREATKTVIGRLSKLRNEMQTNKIILPLTYPSQDADLWNAYRSRYIESCDKEPKWFEAAWLYVECYMYRRIFEAFQLSPAISAYDPFWLQKCSTLVQSHEVVFSLASHLQTTLALQQEPETVSKPPLSCHLSQFLEVALWGNKCDLSMSSGQDNAQLTSPLCQLDYLRPNIVVNDTPDLLDLLQKFFDCTKRDINLHFVLDNAGFELFTDLCLADFLQTTGIVKVINFHVKVMPWFVSDTTEEDFEWLLQYLTSSEEPVLAKLGNRWQQDIQNANWNIIKNKFWTLPHDFSEMKTVAPELYTELRNADLILFKGDLNYRKLVGDLMWESDTSFEKALRGFLPAPLCALRTLKSENIVGLRSNQSEKLAAENMDWKVSGEYAVIQMSVPKL